MQNKLMQLKAKSFDIMRHMEIQEINYKKFVNLLNETVKEINKLESDYNQFDAEPDELSENAPIVE